MGEDHLIGTFVPPGDGIRPIRPGEERRISSWSARAGASEIKSIDAKINSAVLDDASAIGDDADIDNFFTHRRNDLPEWRFWRDSLDAHSRELSAAGPFSRLLVLADVAKRERGFHAEALEGILQSLDASVAAGNLARSAAFDIVQKYVVSRVTLLERNSCRKK